MSEEARPAWLCLNSQECLIYFQFKGLKLKSQMLNAFVSSRLSFVIDHASQISINPCAVRNENSVLTSAFEKYGVLYSKKLKKNIFHFVAITELHA